MMETTGKGWDSCRRVCNIDVPRVKIALFLFHSFNLSQGGVSRGLLGEWAAHGEGQVSSVS